MARYTQNRDEVLRRREIVARLRLRGQSIREICSSLLKLPAKEGGPIYGEDGKSQVGTTTIHRDLKVLEREWRQRAAEAIDERKARQLAEVDEAKRKAWSDGDLQALARFIKLESDIFGTNAPAKLDQFVVDMTRATDEQLTRLAAGEDPRAVFSVSGAGGDGAPAPEEPEPEADLSGH